ncbi:lipopolysaccharide biosynthesis protein [Arthrobacter sp. B1805]|uniref:lipopolysaccharide biosynthesis protein n=1 Tax=Arthrobacter sp. B1805 TaxID=2058892 RepID=UPI0011B06F4B|nr:hypothetical protein [Arthrobacter sp. B1805]
MRPLIARFGTYTAAVAITSIIGLMAIPVVVTQAGDVAWGVIAVAQTLAGLLGVIVSFGWGTTGPAMVAGMPANDRPQMFMESLVSRLYLATVTLPFAILIPFLLTTPEYRGMMIAACCVYLIPFLGGAWYFVGEARPRRLILFDSLPISMGTLAGVVGILLTQEIYVFIACQGVFNIVAVLGTASVIRRSGGTMARPDPSPRAAFGRLPRQLHGVITAATSSLYVGAPLIMVSAFLPAFREVYAMADRFIRYGQIALGPVVQVLQGSIASTDKTVERLRIGRTTLLAPLVGLLGGAGIALVLPWGSALLSNGRIHVGFALSIPIGVVFAGVAVSSIVGLACLIPLGQGRALAVSTVLGASIGLPLIVLAAAFLGPVMVAWSVAISELVVASYQVATVRRVLREGKG